MGRIYLTFTTSEPASWSEPPRHTIGKNVSHICVLREDIKGEVTYKQERHEVRSLTVEGSPKYVVLQAIRKSVRKTAADALMNLGEHEGPQDVLKKFDASFGIILTSETQQP